MMRPTCSCYLYFSVALLLGFLANAATSKEPSSPSIAIVATSSLRGGGSIHSSRQVQDDQQEANNYDNEAKDGQANYYYYDYDANRNYYYEAMNEQANYNYEAMNQQANYNYYNGATNEQGAYNYEGAENYDYEAMQEEDEDDDNFENKSGWNGNWNDDSVEQVKQEAASNFLSMFEKAPSEWNALQWVFAVLLLSVFGFLYCCWCMLCVVPQCCGRKGTMMYAAMAN